MTIASRPVPRAFKVALLLPRFDGAGAERVLVDLAQGLLGRSVAVDFVVRQDSGPLRGSLPAGARTVVLGGSHVSTSVLKLASYLRRERPAGAITALSHMNLTALAANRLVRPPVPLVVTQHNTLSVRATNSASRRDRLVPVLARRLFPRAHRIVAVSEGVADDLATTTGLPRSRIDVIYNPVVLERLRAAAMGPVEHPWLVDRRGPVVLAVGRLTGQKDFGTLLRALALLPADHRLVLLGEGEERADLERLASQLGVEGRVDIHGFVDNPYPYFAAADVFVSSSRWEGLPTVLIEALALGTRIVATDVPSGPREILADGRWGRLVPPGDPAAMASAIVGSLAEDVGDRTGACNAYDLDTVTDRYLELLEMAN